MTRTGPQRIPGAVLGLFFGDGRYSGSDMEVNCGVIHTTEGPTLYDYNGGGSAPTVTAVPDFAGQRLVWHQHFDIDESARALVNAAGGVSTNTANAFQIELVGTCDPATHTKWTSQGTKHIYWPEPPAWAVRDLAWLMRWLRDQHGIPLTGATEWMAYPASYGASRVRMSFDQWRNFTGWCGHQHVPENDHGDPGALPFARILAAARGETAPQPPTVEDDMTPDELLSARMPEWAAVPGPGGVPYVPTVAEVLNGAKTADTKLLALADQVATLTTAVATLTQLVGQQQTQAAEAIAAAVAKLEFHLTTKES